MEAEKKRKREENGEDDRKKKRKERGGKDAATAVPTEEEVEEFFAILRRMRVAVKYFKSNGGREALGTAMAIGTEGLRGCEDPKVEKKISDGAKETAVLDLNVIPDVESNSV